MTDFCHNCFLPVTTDKCDSCGYIAISQAGANIILAPGTVLNGRYLLGRALGAGGFGVTYLAKDNHSGQRVAVKEFMPASFSVRLGDGLTVAASGEDNKKMFEHGLTVFNREAQTLKSFMGQNNIVQVKDNFECNSTAYFVMEFLDGVTLGGLARAGGGKLSVENALEILKLTAGALCEVHKKGMLHRDVSPDNILITRQGEVKLIDFGATRYFVGERSRSLSVVLKAGFAPPEQYSSHGNQGPWTDIYALCATFYNVVVGKRPPDAPDRLNGDNLENLRIYSVATAVSMAIERGLTLDYRKRQQSMEQFLSDIQVSAATPPPQPSVGRQTPPPARPQQPQQPPPQQNNVVNQVANLQGKGAPYISLLRTGMPPDRWLLPKNMPMIIGRSSDKCNIIIDNKNVSRVHCEVRFDEKQAMFYVRDLSSNGTYIDGARLERDKYYTIAPGNRFYIMSKDCMLEVGLC